MNQKRQGLWTCIILIISLVLIMVLSVSAYSSVLSRKDYSDSKRVSLSYLRSMVKNYDTEGGIELRDNGNLLVLKEFDGDYVYELRIYVEDGILLEEYSLEGSKLNPSSAQKIANTDSFNAEFISSSLLKLTTDNGSIIVHLRAAGQGGAI